MFTPPLSVFQCKFSLRLYKDTFFPWKVGNNILSLPSPQTFRLSPPPPPKKKNLKVCATSLMNPTFEVCHMLLLLPQSKSSLSRDHKWVTCFYLHSSPRYVCFELSKNTGINIKHSSHRHHIFFFRETQRKPREKINARNPEGETRASRPRSSGGHFFSRGFLSRHPRTKRKRGCS